MGSDRLRSSVGRKSLTERPSVEKKNLLKFE